MMKSVYAGPVQAGYEDGFLRRIMYGETEVLRMIYFALRDHNWNTLKHNIENEQIIIEDDEFRISYECFHTDGGVDIMHWKAQITGDRDGRIVFEIRGKVLEKFKKNRAGFCVLHPLNVAGKDCSIKHPDGTTTTRDFPAAVAADNPFLDIQSMTWTAADNHSEFRLTFEGDVFETEDQRNWGDASFKTFCTPLIQPFPVEMSRGHAVFQRITFHPVKPLPALKAMPGYVSIEEALERAVVPALGIAASTEVSGLSNECALLVKSLRLNHYRIDLFPGSPDFALHFSNAYETAYSTGLPLETALHLTNNFMEETEAFIILCRQNKVRLKKVLLLSTNGLVTRQDVVDQTLQLKASLPGVLFGAGTNYNFNEINKNIFQASGLDYISFAIDPQEHASDDITILENSSELDTLVKSAKSIYGGHMPIHVSPFTLRKRFNPYATDPKDFYIDEHLKADPRQKGNLAALSTFAAVLSLASGGASAITFFQSVGNQGIISVEGQPYPVYDVLRNFARYQGRSLAILKSSDPLEVIAAVLDGKALALANLSDGEKAVRFKGSAYSLGPREIRFHTLDRT